jgi:hypothetical protein
MTRHTARASRTGLVIIGLILLLGAGAVLARSLNASTSVLGNPHAPLLTHGQVQYPTKNSWVWPVVAAASFLIAVLALWWMAAQTRIRAVRRMPLEPDRVHGTTTLALAEARVEDDMQRFLETHPRMLAQHLSVERLAGVMPRRVGSST